MMFWFKHKHKTKYLPLALDFYMRMFHRILKAWMLLLVFFGLTYCNSDTNDEIEETQAIQNQIESPTKAIRSNVVTADIEEGIKQHINKVASQNNGFFKLDTGGGIMSLKLVRVHTEYLSNLSHNKHFACVDLVDEYGDVYDVDFFLTGPKGRMEVTSTSVHKLNGKPFYTWKQQPDKSWKKIPVDEADNRLLGIIENEDSFKFYYKILLPTSKKKSKIWIPIPQTDYYQDVVLDTVLGLQSYQYTNDKQFNNKILFAEFSPRENPMEIELHYSAKRREKSAYEDTTPENGKFLQSNQLMPVNRTFEKLADSIIGKKFNQEKLVWARALYDYVIDNMKYMKYGKFGNGDAQHACDSKTGNCTEFHSLFISLARSVNIPARFAVGVAIPSDRNDGGIDGYHCWAEFFADGKWWPIDISEANKYSALATYYFGHHPANRLELSKGRDLVVSNYHTNEPINFLAYPVYEEDGNQKSVRTLFEFLR